MARRRKYFLDPVDLQYKQVKLPWKKKFFRAFMFIGVTSVLTFIYATLFHNYFGSPKEKILSQEIENLKFEYSIVSKDIAGYFELLDGLKMSDEIRYRTILNMDSIPGQFRNPAFGGIDRFSNLDGYRNTPLLKQTRTKIEEIKNMASVQAESFTKIAERITDWRYEMDHLPAISPVDPSFKLGDGLRFRDVHPVLGTGRMHYGQDFNVPYGTKVYATGDGKVVESGWNSGGYGNVVMIDHGNGLQSIYGHLSEIRVPDGMNVKRGDMIGLSGSSGLSSGPHLHYQINKFGQAIRPTDLFNVDLSQEEYQDMIEAFASKSRFR
jgi:hypothetical protein